MLCANKSMHMVRTGYCSHMTADRTLCHALPCMTLHFIARCICLVLPDKTCLAIQLCLASAEGIAVSNRDLCELIIGPRFIYASVEWQTRLFFTARSC
jgi:hypothetical protein